MSGSIRLGLIGDNLATSQSPRLHQLARQLSAQTVTYNRLVPRELGKTFEDLFDYCARNGYRGVIITYPYKKRVVNRVAIKDELVRAIGPENTVVFDNGQALGLNTDYSGFVAYRGTCGDTPPGPAYLVGAGGVERAIAFGLAALGARDIRIADQDPVKGKALAAALDEAWPGVRTEVSKGADSVTLAHGLEGVVNNTRRHGRTRWDTVASRLNGRRPLGLRRSLHAHEHCVPARRRGRGLTIITGYELFIGQDVDAWKLFTGITVDSHRLRAALQQPDCL